MLDVLRVPDFQYNLLSIHKLCQQLAGKVVFSSTDCTLQGPMLQEVALGKVVDGLYYVSQGNTDAATRNDKLVMQSGSTGNFQQPVFHQTNSLSEEDTWHFRLGHLSFERMRKLCLPCNQKKHSTICSICPQAKLHRKPFPLSTSAASRIFELIHVDIWGAYKCSTYN